MASSAVKEHPGTLLALIEIEDDVVSLSYNEILTVAELCHERVTKKPYGLLLTGTTLKLMKYIGRVESTPKSVDIAITQDALQIHSGNYMVSHQSLSDVVVMMAIPESDGNLVIISKCLKKSKTIGVVLNMVSSQEADGFISMVGEHRMKVSAEQRSSQSQVMSKESLNSTSIDENDTASNGYSYIGGSVPISVNISETKKLETHPSIVSALPSPSGAQIPNALTAKPAFSQYVPSPARSSPLTLRATPFAVGPVPNALISKNPVASTTDSEVTQSKPTPPASSLSKLTLQKTPLAMVPIYDTPRAMMADSVVSRLKTSGPQKISKVSTPVDKASISSPRPSVQLKPALNFTPRQGSPTAYSNFLPHSPTVIRSVRKPLVYQKPTFISGSRTAPPLSASPFRQTLIPNVKNCSEMKSQAPHQSDANMLTSSEAHTMAASVPTNTRLSLFSPQPFNQFSTAIPGTVRNSSSQHPTTRMTKAKSMVELPTEPIPEPSTGNRIQALQQTFHVSNDQGSKDDSFIEISSLSTVNNSLMEKEMLNYKCQPVSKPQLPPKTKIKGKKGTLINRIKDRRSVINDKLIYLNTKILKNIGDNHKEHVETNTSSGESVKKLDKASISIVHCVSSFNDQTQNISAEQETDMFEAAASSSDTAENIYETIGNSGDSAYYEEVNPRRNSITVSTTSETNDSSYVSDEYSDFDDDMSIEHTHSTPSTLSQSLEHVINSFLISEYEYLEKLERLRNVKKYLPPRMQSLLRGINILHDFHVNMYGELYDAKDSCLKIANVFISFKDDLKKYKVHLMNSPTVSEQLKSLGPLVETNPNLKEDLRIMWKRLHFYHMNLEKMQSLCQEDEKATLSEAIDMLRSLNLEADRGLLLDSIKDAPYNVHLLGALLIHHTFKVTWPSLIRAKNLHAFLFPNLIVLASPNGDLYDYQRDIPIGQAKFVTCNHDNKFILEVDLGGSRGKQMYTFKTNKSEVKGEWLKEITALMCKLMEKEITERNERYGIETEHLV